MVSLAIDIGNTRTKAAVFRSGELLFRQSLEKPTKEQIRDLYISNKEISHTIISSVAGEFSEVVETARNHSKLVVLSPSVILPVSINYQGTPGNDRIASASAVSIMNSGGNSLVIDCGTCITYTLVSEGKRFEGGAISPGIRLRYLALNSFTANLPLLNFDNEMHPLTGNSTAGSIHSGVLNAAVAEAKVKIY